MIKEAGAFVQNVVQPMMDQAEDLLWFLETHGLHADDFRKILRKAFIAQLVITFMRCLTQIVIACIICYTVWRVW